MRSRYHQAIARLSAAVTGEKNKPLCDNIDKNYKNDGSSIREVIARWMDPATRQSVVDEYGDIGDWNTSQVTDMEGLFYNCVDFDEDISRWDTKRVTTMESMFEEASSFNQPVGAWDVSNVKNMISMFENASSFNKSVEDWKIERVEYMDKMFDGATSLSASQRPTWLRE